MRHSIFPRTATTTTATSTAVLAAAAASGIRKIPSRRGYSSSYSSCWKTSRRHNRWLACLAVAAVVFQLGVVYQATQNGHAMLLMVPDAGHHPHQPSPPQKLLREFKTRKSTGGGDNNDKHKHKHDLSSSQQQIRRRRPPRLLIGIMANANNHMGLVYRERHRELFQLWNDSRFCVWNELESNDDSSYSSCQVAYTFVLGGHNATSSVPPYHLGNNNNNDNDNDNDNGSVLSRPLTLESIPSMPRFKDVASHNDLTILNIRENMNDGKTPTFFHWAATVARERDFDYIMKCDSDAFLRWNALWRFLYKELPWPRPTGEETAPGAGVLAPPSTLLGAFRHKAYWTDVVSDETLWKQEWYAGMHLYLAGQLYVLSVDVAEVMVVEARKWYKSRTSTSTSTSIGSPTSTSFNTTFAAPFFAGHEDHDATSMTQQDPTVIQRWISIPKHTTFWEHPVKGDYRWQRILAREQRQQVERLEGKRPAIPHFEDDISHTLLSSNATRSRPSLLVIVLDHFTSVEEVAQQREEYLKEWKKRNYWFNNDFEENPSKFICSVSKYFATTSNNNDCDLYYVFVVGIQNDGPTEVLTNAKTLRFQPQPPFLGSDEHGGGDDDTITATTWYFNVRHSIHQGIGTTLLYYLNEELPNYTERLELIVLIQSNQWLRWDKFQQVVHTQSSGHALVVGEMRDKYQEPREVFSTHKQPLRRREEFWYGEFDNIHLYLGSDCLAFGTSLIAGIVGQAQSNEEARSKYWEDHLGHDLTVLAYFVPKVILHWVPMTKSLRFWEA